MLGLFALFSIEWWIAVVAAIALIVFLIWYRKKQRQ